MILFLYNVALLLLLVAGLPYWLLLLLTREKYREGIRERLGRVRASLVQRPRLHPAVWIHAVSVGEVLAVSQLVWELDQRAPAYRVLISTTTRTGQQLARQRFGAERCFYFPLDLRWVVARYFRALLPAMLVLAESEFWPNVLSQCRRSGTPVVVVNARISDRSLPRYRALRSLWRPFLNALSQVLAQSEEDARRYVSIGVPAERVSVSGNLKFDVRVPAEAPIVEALRKRLPDGVRVLVCGSTLEGEESLLLDAWKSLEVADRARVMILAPRRPERFDKVAQLLERSGVPWERRSAGLGGGLLPIGSVLLLDSIGELASVYALASVAFVGGSLLNGGGHNPLEPAQFGVPILMGPSYANFRGIVEQLTDCGGLEIVDGQTLAPRLLALMTDTQKAQAMGAHAREVFAHEAGATERTMAVLLALLDAHGANA